MPGGRKSKGSEYFLSSSRVLSLAHHSRGRQLLCLAYLKYDPAVEDRQQQERHERRQSGARPVVVVHLKEEEEEKYFSG